MNVVVAMDSFKGSLSSLRAGNAVKAAIQKLHPEAAVTVKPLADGGEGTVDALCAGLSGQRIRMTVKDPMQQPVEAEYCILIPSGTAVIECAAAAGITLLSDRERDPLKATTYGVGQMIADAVARGCRRFIIGIGGSATNDGGTGMLTALGAEFLDQAGKPIALGAQGLQTLHSIRLANLLPELAECSFQIACDVDNPLCGERGCSAVYGPQKGATPGMIKDMDDWLTRYAKLAGQVSAKADENYPGAGAAGGLGFAFLSFTNAQLRPGIQIVLEEIAWRQTFRTPTLW